MLPHIYTNGTLSVSLPDGTMKQIDTAHPNYNLIIAAVKAGLDRKALELINIEAEVKESLVYTDNITVENGEILYNGTSIHNTLTKRILTMLKDGFNVDHMVLFLENLMLNPSHRAVNELYDFLEAGSIPITEKGTFLAYKKVREDFTDIHSGSFDNSPGKIVSMPRNMVDEDSENTCSAGLHACSYDYLSQFGSCSDNKVLMLEINPMNVVAIPSDYNNTKMRVCEYKVLKEIDNYKEDILAGKMVIEINEKENSTDHAKYLGKLVTENLIAKRMSVSDLYDVLRSSSNELLKFRDETFNAVGKGLPILYKAYGKEISKFIRDNKLDAFTFEDNLMDYNEESEYGYEGYAEEDKTSEEIDIKNFCKKITKSLDDRIITNYSIINCLTDMKVNYKYYVHYFDEESDNTLIGKFLYKWLLGKINSLTPLPFVFVHNINQVIEKNKDAEISMPSDLNKNAKELGKKITRELDNNIIDRNDLENIINNMSTSLQSFDGLIYAINHAKSNKEIGKLITLRIRKNILDIDVFNTESNKYFSDIGKRIGKQVTKNLNTDLKSIIIHALSCINVCDDIIDIFEHYKTDKEWGKGIAKLITDKIINPYVFEETITTFIEDVMVMSSMFAKEEKDSQTFEVKIDTLETTIFEINQNNNITVEFIDNNETELKGKYNEYCMKCGRALIEDIDACPSCGFNANLVVDEVKAANDFGKRIDGLLATDALSPAVILKSFTDIGIDVYTLVDTKTLTRILDEHRIGAAIADLIIKKLIDGQKFSTAFNNNIKAERNNIIRCPRCKSANMAMDGECLNCGYWAFE